ncbi:hypothetical protein V8E52_004157 [Russula decolorans]
MKSFGALIVILSFTTSVLSQQTVTTTNALGGTVTQTVAGAAATTSASQATQTALYCRNDCTNNIPDCYCSYHGNAGPRTRWPACHSTSKPRRANPVYIHDYGRERQYRDRHCHFHALFPRNDAIYTNEYWYCPWIQSMAQHDWEQH